MVLPFAATVFGPNRPRDAAYSSLWPPSNHFSSHNLQNQLVKYPGPFRTRQHWLLSLTSYYLLLTNHELPDSSELFHGGGGHRQQPGQHAPAGPLGLPFSELLLPWRQSGSRWHGALFPRGEAQGLRETQKCKTSAAAMPSSRTCRRHLQMSAVKPKRQWKPLFPRGRAWTGQFKPFGTAGPGFCLCRPPPLWLSGEPLPRWAGETHGDYGHMASLSGLAGLQRWWAKAHPQSTNTRRPWTLEEPLRTLSSVRVSAWSPFLQPLRSFLTMELPPKPWTKWKQ